MQNQTENPAAAQAQKAPETPNGKPKPAIVTRSVKHAFTPEERQAFGDELARQVGTLRQVEADLTSIKASYKAKTEEAEARINKISTDIVNGFEMRDKRCQVLFFPAERKKRFWLENDDPAAVPHVGEDAMTNEDYQAELLQAESKFEKLCTVDLFNSAGADQGIMVIGFLGKRWYAAIRAKIGKTEIKERLDSLQPAAKNRFDAVKQAADRYWTWLNNTLGKDNAKGFKEPMEKAVLSQKERAE